ncbi:MAG: DUF1320 family protein [Deltaproteobacteria bacterium]|nr:DUF1320 family protein [Deltaproteobacteria bacterium]
MAYSVHQDILDRMSIEELIRLTTTGTEPSRGMTDAEKEALVNWDIVDALIKDSDDQIDFYASGHAPLPLNPVSGVATKISATLTICSLWRRRPYATKAQGASTSTQVDAITKSCNDMQTLLDKIASGDLDITAPVVVKSPNAVTFSVDKREFSRDSMKGY